MHRRFSAPDIDFDAIRGELGLSEEYGANALAEAGRATDRCAADRADHTRIPLVSIDPPGSMDLDQAVHVAADGDGFVIDYAIADVGALIEPEGPLDQESRRRGTTIYFPDGSVPLHPRVLSEDRGSLLPGVARAAVLWTIAVSAAGEVTDVEVRRATVRSVARLDYTGVAADAVAGTLHPSIAALPRFGELRRRAALARGAIELDLPDQDVVRDDGGWTLRLAPHTAADMWNSQVSLLTGMCAGTIMSGAGIGLLRTLPPAPPEAVTRLRHIAGALGVRWPAEASPGEFLATLPTDEPATLALMSAAATLMRGSGYLALGDSTQPRPTPDAMTHAAIGGVYAHVTAPLRRLGDRFATEACLAITAGKAVPEWVIRALPTLPAILRSAGSLSSTAEGRSVDLAEATVLADRVGEHFDAVVLSAGNAIRSGRVFIADPAVVAVCSGTLVPATRVRVELVTADSARRLVEFAPV